MSVAHGLVPCSQDHVAHFNGLFDAGPRAGEYHSTFRWAGARAGAEVEADRGGAGLDVLVVLHAPAARSAATVATSPP